MLLKITKNCFCFFTLIVFTFCTVHNCKAFPLSSSTPADGATNVARETNITLNFPNNACDNYTMYFWIKKASDDSGVELIYADTGTGLGTQTLTFNPTVTLAANTAYYLQSFGGTFNDCGPPYNPNDVFRVDFTTGTCLGDGTCPLCYPVNAMVCCATPEEASIKHLSPPDNAHFMQNYEGISIVFNGNTSVAAGNIVIKKYSDDTVVETIDIASNQVTGWGTRTITINPSVNLEANTQYYVNFPIDGYRDASDKDGWNFWTKSTPNTFGSGF